MNWLDPEFWKVPADLAEHWQKIAVATVAIVAAIGTFFRWGWAPIRWLLAGVTARRPAVNDLNL